MILPTIKELLRVGAHFGHKRDKTNPVAKKEYCFGIKEGIYIIDLSKTQKKLSEVLDYILQLSNTGQTVLFVGTKRQVKDAVKNTAEAIEMPYVNNRWLGGMLTNFETVRVGIKKLKNFEAEKETEEYKKITKQEKAKFNKKLAKLQANLGGIRNLEKLPDALFVVDTVKEKVAVEEAKKKNIPVIGICDVDADPNLTKHYIPANNQSKPTIELIMQFIKENIKATKSKT